MIPYYLTCGHVAEGVNAANGVADCDPARGALSPPLRRVEVMLIISCRDQSWRMPTQITAGDFPMYTPGPWLRVGLWLRERTARWTQTRLAGGEGLRARTPNPARMTQPEHVGDHRVTMTQAEKHQVPQVHQRAQQHDPQYPIHVELSGSHLAHQR